MKYLRLAYCFNKTHVVLVLFQIPLFVSSSTGPHEADYLNYSVNESVKKDESMQWKNMTNALVLSSIAWLLQASSILALLFLANKGKITIGDFALIFMLSITVIDQIWFLTESLLGIGETVGICEQALKTIFAKHEYVEQPNISKLKITQGNITLKQINFNYQRSINLFNDLNLTIKGGDKIALVGFSGGGKSSLINLITRLFETNHGEILIDDQNIKNISAQSLRENISFIPQDPSLFHRSILENIQYGKLNASLEEVIDAAKKAYAHEFITELQDGYNTIVGERGIKLSGGQRQRIAIARAILKNAPILILDEATSSLDSLTESRIQKSLTYAMNNKTVIVIAHRLSTVLAMDIIYVLDKGEIIESGHHQELVEKGGLYKELWDLQKGHSYI